MLATSPLEAILAQVKRITPTEYKKIKARIIAEEKADHGKKEQHESKKEAAA